MYDLEINNNKYKNQGLSQFERVSEQLEPGYFSIDEFDLEKFVAFISEISSKISFFDDSNKLVGDWSLFFKRDPTFALIRLSSLNIELIRSRYFEKMRSFNSIRSDKKLSTEISNYSDELVNSLMDIEHNIVQLSSSTEYKSEIQLIVKNNLSRILAKLIAISSFDSKSKTDDYRGEFSDYWLVEEQPEKILKPTIHDLESIFSFYLNSLKLIQKTSKEFFRNNVLKNGQVNPYTSLLITFHRIYKHASDELNNITGRHLLHYYNEVLGLKIDGCTPHEVYVSFKIEEGLSHLVLHPDNILKGSVSDLGEDILYGLKNEVLVSQAEINRIIVMEMGNPLSIHTGINQSYVKPEIYSLSQTQKDIDDNNSFGFSFGAEFLKNIEGYRKIKFKFCFTEESFSSFIYHLEDLIDAQKEKDVTMQNVLDDAFNVKYSSVEDWVHLSNESVDASFLQDNSEYFQPTIIIDTFIDVTKPPITNLFGSDGFDSDTEGFPQFQFLLNPIKSDLLFLLRLLKLSKIEVETELLDIKQLVLSNDDGEIDTNGTFEPFGSQPIIGNALYIGHPSIFLYPISELKLNIEWHGLPLLEGGFHEYYEHYPDIEGNDTFKVKISSLRDKRWLPDEDKQVLDLFETTSKDNSDALSSIRRMTEINIKELEIDEPIVYEARNFEYNSSSIAGFLKLELCFPLIAFGHGEYPEVTRMVAAKNAKAKKYTDYPNEPFTPVVKSLSLEVKSKMTYDHTNESKYSLEQIYPFGSQEISVSSPLFPDVNSGTSLLIGLSNMENTNHINFLFRFTDSVNDILVDDFNLKWSLFNGITWEELNAENIIQDTTAGFKQNGIIEFNFPPVFSTSNNLLSDNSRWLRCESGDGHSFIDLIEDIIPNSAKVYCLNQNMLDVANIQKDQINSFQDDVDGVISIEQKYPSFGGALKESELNYFTRVSERLHHKDRAVTERNFEHLVLSRFSQIYKCKCLANRDASFQLAPGNVLISVVPSISRHSGGKFVGKFSTIELREMEIYLSSKAPIGVKVSVINPIYEKVRTKFNVKFREGYDPNFYIKKLNSDISSFISPFLFRKGEQIEFSEVIQSTHILNTIEKQDYIDHVVNFSVFHLVDDVIINQNEAKRNSLEIIPTTDISILMTDDYHQISTYDDKYVSDSGGINEMMVGTDYVVDSPEEEVKQGISSMTIGTNYKVLDYKEEKITEKSNFTIHLNI